MVRTLLVATVAASATVLCVPAAHAQIVSLPRVLDEPPPPSPAVETEHIRHLCYSWMERSQERIDRARVRAMVAAFDQNALSEMHLAVRELQTIVQVTARCEAIARDARMVPVLPNP